MSETTQILFNSPALHALKRDQLVKLCKIHDLKVSGKKQDLIARLNAHADALRATTTADDSRDNDNETLSQPPSFAYSTLARPSEQWEVVMDDIQELPEGDSRTRSLSSSSGSRTGGSDTDEFGLSNSKCMSSTFLNHSLMLCDALSEMLSHIRHAALCGPATFKSSSCLHATSLSLSSVSDLICLLQLPMLAHLSKLSRVLSALANTLHLLNPLSNPHDPVHVFSMLQRTHDLLHHPTPAKPVYENPHPKPTFSRLLHQPALTNQPCKI
jgi:hypothetical protein